MPSRRLSIALLAAAACGVAAAALADVVVLKGGTVVPLKQPIVRKGNTAYLTRADGTLLSVPVSEIDRAATAAANQTAAAPASAPEAAPASTPAEAARATTDSSSPKARVRITDADVSHPLEYTEPEESKPEASGGPGGPRVEVADYTQDLRASTLMIKGSLRNVGQAPAEGVRMQVTALDDKGQPIEGTTAALSKGSIPSGQSVDFTATMDVGQKTAASLRFTPQWTAPKPPPPPPGSPGAAAAAGAGGARPGPPSPQPTPYGRGSLYAPPVGNAPSQPPADGKTGYLPGPASADQQPKPPSR